MSDDALGKLLVESAELYQESDDPRSGIEYTRDYLHAHGVVVLSPDHPLRMGEPTSDWRVPLWDAIHEYVRSCGGDPDRYVYGNMRRMEAVAAVEGSVRAALASPRRST